MVDPGGAVEIVFVDTAGAEVLAALVSEGIKEVARARTVSSLEGAGVECNSLVPGVDGAVVALDAVGLAVIKGVLELAKDVLEDVQDDGSLLGDLLATDKSGSSHVDVAIGKVGDGAVKGSHDDLICVVEFAIVVVCVGVVLVGTAWAAVVHLLLGAGGETGDGADGRGGVKGEPSIKKD